MKRNRWVEVHAGFIIVGMKLLTLLYAKRRFHFSEELFQGEVFRPGQIEHLHITQYRMLFQRGQFLFFVIYSLLGLFFASLPFLANDVV